MRKFITAALSVVLQVISLIVIAVAIGTGWSLGKQSTAFGEYAPHIFAVGGLLAGFAFVSIVFGFMFVLIEIRENTRETAQNTKAMIAVVSGLDAQMQMQMLQKLRRPANSQRSSPPSQASEAREPPAQVSEEGQKT